MLTLKPTSFLERIKLPANSVNHIKVAVDILNMDKFYIRFDTLNFPLSQFRHYFHLRNAIEDLIQSGELEFCGIKTNIRLVNGLYDVSDEVNELRYVHAEYDRETTKQKPRHIKLGFMFF
jgi:hypothetical protein